MTPAAVSCRQLTRVFAGEPAVTDLTFDVAPGELFGLVGPDGAGKTTTLRMLAGILRPSGGDALVHGVSVANHPEDAKHKTAYMSQRFGLYTDLTVRENIDFYADIYRVPRSDRVARLEQLYEFSRLGPFEHRVAGQLSGGMKQKLSLCCALIHRPHVMLLDEPTFGVDPLSRRDLWMIIHQMVAEGVTVIASTAYLDEAERCDRIAFLHEGRVVALENPATLQDRFRGTIVSLHTDDPRRARDTLQPLGQVRSANLFGTDVHIVVDDADASWPAVLAALTDAAIRIERHETIRPSLEDVFIDTVTPRDAPAGAAP